MSHQIKKKTNLWRVRQESSSFCLNDRQRKAKQNGFCFSWPDTTTKTVQRNLPVWYSTQQMIDRETEVMSVGWTRLT